jgi:PIN domain nuclease of toxin-antitoxin system
MSKIVVDSSAWIEYFEGTPKGEKVREFLAKSDTFPLITGVIATEVISKFLRSGHSAQEITNALGAVAMFVPYGISLAQKTAEVYAKQRKTKPKFGMADANVLAAAMLNNAKIITCDTDFAGLSEAIVIK